MSKMNKDKMIKVDNKLDKSQWLSFRDYRIRGGIILNPGKNFIDENIWDQLSGGPWLKKLIERGEIEVENYEEKKIKKMEKDIEKGNLKINI